MSEQLAYDLDILMGYRKQVWTPGHKLPPKLGQRVLIHFEGRISIITYKKDYFEGEEFYWMSLPEPPKADIDVLAATIYEAGCRKQSDGEWITHSGSYECSVCKEECYNEFAEDFDPIEDYGFHFCPHCGARMKGAGQ